MAHISDDLAKNYEQLREERGCSWEQLASEHEPTDPNIAAWFRGRASVDSVSTPKARKATPKAKG